MKKSVKKKPAVKKRAATKKANIVTSVKTPGGGDLSVRMNRESMVIGKTPRDTAAANVDRSVKTGKWISIAIRIEGGQIKLERTAVSFPKEDIDTVMRMIADDLNKLKVG